MRKNSIGIVSGKGGVGKTTITANLGVCLAKYFNVNTIVIDANVLTSNLGLHLGFVREPVSLHDVLQNKLQIDQVIYVHSSGLNVIPSSIAVDATIDASALGETITYLEKNYDYVITDSAPGLSKEALVVMDACDSFIVVTNPELPAVTDAIKTISVLENKKKHILGIALNKITGNKYELTKHHIERVTDYPVIAEIPYDEHVPASISYKTPVVLYAPNCKASVKLKALAAWLCDKPYVEPRESIWLRLFHLIFG